MIDRFSDHEMRDKAEQSETSVRLLTKRGLVALAVIIAGSFVLAFSSTVWEIAKVVGNRKADEAAFRARVEAAVEGVGKTPAGPTPPVHPIDFFPKEIKGFITFGEQRIRGEEGNAAECIFKPEDELYAVVNPQNVYARVTYYGTDGAAQRAAEKFIADKEVVKRVDVALEGLKPIAGYNADGSDFVVVWVWNGYAFILNSSYTRKTPEIKNDSLQNNAMIVAKEIMKKTRRK